MTTVFVVDDVFGIHRRPTTHALLLAQAARDDTWVASAADWTVDIGVRVVARRFHANTGRPGARHTFKATEVDLVVVRLNPTTTHPSWVWEHALTALAWAESEGVNVQSSPAVLDRFSTKAGLLWLSDAVRPPMVLCGSLDPALDAIDVFGRSVVKPVRGSHGAGVFMVEPDQPNTRTAIELLLRDGAVVVQPWLEAAVDGDVRVFMCDGHPLEVGGHIAAIHRRPAPGELRSNIHLGGRAGPATLTPTLRALLTRVGAELLALGVRFAGVDCIGDRIVEVNVGSPGGLHDMEDAHDVAFVDAWLNALQAPPATVE